MLEILPVMLIGCTCRDALLDADGSHNTSLSEDNGAAYDLSLLNLFLNWYVSARLSFFASIFNSAWSSLLFCWRLEISSDRWSHSLKFFSAIPMSTRSSRKCNDHYRISAKKLSGYGLTNRTGSADPAVGMFIHLLISLVLPRHLEPTLCHHQWQPVEAAWTELARMTYLFCLTCCTR